MVVYWTSTIVLGQVNNDLQNITSKTKLQLVTEDGTEAITSPFSVDHVPKTGKEQSELMNFLFDFFPAQSEYDRKIIGRPSNRIEEKFIHWKKLALSKERLGNLNPTEGVNILILRMIPCILHFETRMWIKSIIISSRRL